ncbi:MAG TPA: glycosyltransferase family 1 protein [Chloroflexia bacterium]|nr:glycosyltransferase family 1 protein [Chloroflexia bacterium]
MHVAINGHFWGQPHTGSGQYLRHLWSALAGLGPDDTYTLLLPPGAGDEPSQSERMRVKHAMPARFVGGRSANLDKLLFEAWGAARAARRVRAGVLHVPYLAAPLPGAAGMPVVVTAHDMIPWVVPGYAGSPAVKVYLRLAAAFARRARLVLADSEASRRDAIKVLRMPPSRVRTVYLGMEQHPEYTPEELREVRERHGLPEAYAFYLGGFDRRKNVPLLLRAWRTLVESVEAEQPVLAVGGGVPEPGGVFPDVRGEARRLGLDGPGGPVRFIGRVSEEDKPRLMAGARLFAYPSAYEGFGLDPLEAMSVGCPVVSSSGGSLREVVGEGGLLVPPGDEGALAGALKRVWSDTALRADLSAKGREQAGRFTWERTAEQTRQAYRVAAGKAGG